MPWTKVGDSAATYPRLMQTAGLAGADERTVNEVAGWLWRCAFQSAAHMTDYVIDLGTAYMLGGSRTEELIRLCTRTGLLKERNVNGMRHFELVADPEFINIRLKQEVEWERQQNRDTKNHELRVPILLRDGDQCRYCGKVVAWRGRTTNRSGSLDHRAPGAAGTVETMVVACVGCNSARGRVGADEWEKSHPLLPPPRTPLYGTVTAKYLAEHGHFVEANLAPQGRVSDDFPANSTPPEEHHPTAEEPRHDAENGAPGNSAGNLTTDPGKSRDLRSGREGTESGGGGEGMDGSGRDPQPTQTQQSRRPRRRGSRGGAKRRKQSGVNQ